MTIYVQPTFIRPNGEPYSGGYVKIFESGSYSTYKTTYIDSSMTIPNTNPIVLNGNGSADIWFTGPADYEVYDQNWVFQYRQNGVYGLGSASINIDTVNRTLRNLRADDDMTVTLGLATDRCQKLLGLFDCDGNPTLVTAEQLAAILQLTVIEFIDLGFFCCPFIDSFDFGSFTGSIVDYVDFGIF